VSVTRPGRDVQQHSEGEVPYEKNYPDPQPVLLTGHYDVVPVIPGTEELWTHQPFSGDIKDGVVWAAVRWMTRVL